MWIALPRHVDGGWIDLPSDSPKEAIKFAISIFEKWEPYLMVQCLRSLDAKWLTSMFFDEIAKPERQYLIWLVMHYLKYFEKYN